MSRFSSLCFNLTRTMLIASMSLTLTAKVWGEDGFTNTPSSTPSNVASKTSSLASSNSSTTATSTLALADQQVLNFNFTSLSTIDPSQLYFSIDFALSRMLFDTLIRQNNQGEFVPSAAKSYSVSADGKIWTFKLRHDAKWSDGKPVVAADYVYSWQRLADPKTAAPYAYYLPLMNLQNAQAIIDGKLPPTSLGIKALDDYTLQVTLDQATPWFLTMLPISVLAPLRQDIITKYGRDWTQPQHLVNNGPFKLVSYHLNDTLKLVNNPDYWDASHNKITNINIDFIADSNGNYYGYLSGKYLTGGIPPALKDLAFKEHHKELIYATKNYIQYLLINAKTVPDVRIRQAINMLVNRSVYTNKIIKFGLPTTQVAPSSIRDGQYLTERSWFTLPYDQRVKQAQALIAQAGYSPQKPLVLEYLTGAANSDRFFIALRNWLKVGSNGAIILNAKGVESRIYNELVDQKDYQLTSKGWNADYPQVSTFLNQFTCGNAINNTSFCNKAYDQLLNQANHNLDPQARAKLYAQANDILTSDYQVTGLFQAAGFFLKSPKLQGYNPYIRYNYYNDFYILKDIPECFKADNGTSMCATDLTRFKQVTGFKPIPIPAQDPYQ